MELTTITLDLIKLGMFSGYVLIIFGLLFLFCPKALIRVNNLANKLLVNLDTNSFSHRIIMGMMSLVIGTGILYLYSNF